MSALLIDIANVAWPYLLNVTSLGFTYLLYTLTTWVRARTQSDIATNATKRLGEAVENGAAVAVARLRPTWKRITADDKVTAEELEELLDEAVAVAKSMVGEIGLKDLESILGADAVTKLLRGKVETLIAALLED